MKALSYVERGRFALLDKPEPRILHARDAIVRVTLGSICTSDLHIKHGSVPRAVVAGVHDFIAVNLMARIPRVSKVLCRTSNERIEYLNQE